MFTGDPGLKGGDESDRNTLIDKNIIIKDFPDGRPFYVNGDNGEDPDKYRYSSLSFGVGSVRVGRNSEKIRNIF